MNIFSLIKKDVLEATNNLINTNILPKDLSLNNINVEPPRDYTHGDIATNVAMVLSKSAKMNPRDLATKYVELLKDKEYIDSIDIAGAGFINIRLKKNIWYQILKEIHIQGANFGDSEVGVGRRVNLEYVSANPTGPMHIGHARGAVFGDALSAILKKCGFDVTKEYYINDAGNQINILASSLLYRYKEALGVNSSEFTGGYSGSYLIDAAQNLKAEYGDSLLALSEEKAIEKIKPFVIEAMMKLIKNDLKILGVEHDIFTSELKLHQNNEIEKVVEKLKSKGLIYKGILEKPKGSDEEWEEREQLLFKSTEFGDDIDRALQKSDGTWTYFAADMAYMQDKISRGYTDIYMVLGADHIGYKKRMEAIAASLSEGKINFEIRFCQLVNFVKDGQPLKMSKRAGTYITIDQVVEEVGKSVTRFTMLSRKNDTVFDFDLEKVIEQSKDNPVFYVQYAHARAKSILRRSEIGYEEVSKADTSLLSTEYEMKLIRLLASYPRIVEAAALYQDPHRIVNYLHEIATEFHFLWNIGKEDVLLKMIVENDKNLTIARLYLVFAVSVVIASGLELLGIEPLEKL